MAKQSMRILLTNDDGIWASGLGVLESIARQITDDIWIVAPQTEKSGVGRACTFNHPLRLTEVSQQKFSVDGTPADCVSIALEELLKDQPPDVVLSGVNLGENLADSITCSGTIGAAMEASLRGVPAMALSQTTKGSLQVEWAAAEHFAPALIKQLLENELPSEVLMNINFPRRAIDEVTGIRVVPHSKRKNLSNSVACVDPKGELYYWVGVMHEEKNLTFNTDLWAIEEGYIAVTPIGLELTHHQTLKALDETLSRNFEETPITVAKAS